MKIGMILNTKEPEKAWNAFRFANTSLKAGHETRKRRKATLLWRTLTQTASTHTRKTALSENINMPSKKNAIEHAKKKPQIELKSFISPQHFPMDVPLLAF